MWVCDLLFADKIAQDKETILDFGFQPGCTARDSLAEMVAISHIQKENIGTDSIHERMFTSQTIENYTELDLMDNIVSATVMWDLELSALGKNAKQNAKKLD